MKDIIHFSSFGMKQKLPGYVFESASHNNLHISVIISGKVQIETPLFNYEVTPGMLMCIKPGEVIKISSPTDGYTGIHCALIPHSYVYQIPTVITNAGNELLYTSGLIHREITRDKPDAISIIPSLFELFVKQAFRKIRETSNIDHTTSAGYWSKMIKERIDNLIYTPISTKALLGSFSLSNRQLLRYFSMQTGISIKQYQIQKRIEESKRLLLESTLSITSIAFELYFPSSQHFSTQFKKTTGKTPKEFRNKKPT